MKKLRLMTEDKLNSIIQAHVAEALKGKSMDYEKEILLKRTNLVILQSQINPHFLYNTLECIRGMALLEGQNDIADITWSLSRFFRYNINSTNDIVTIGDELENIRSYVNIQQYRFKDRFQLIVESSPDMENAVLPKLTLQPIVENAILHGLSDQDNGGAILVRVMRVGKNVQITVSDNGKGMEPDELALLIKKIRDEQKNESEEKHHTGIGMRNVDKRLKLYFGAEFGVSILSCPGGGTDVEVLFPYLLSIKKE